MTDACLQEVRAISFIQAFSTFNFGAEQAQRQRAKSLVVTVFTTHQRSTDVITLAGKSKLYKLSTPSHTNYIISSFSCSSVKAKHFANIPKPRFNATTKDFGSTRSKASPQHVSNSPKRYSLFFSRCSYDKQSSNSHHRKTSREEDRTRSATPRSKPHLQRDARCKTDNHTISVVICNEDGVVNFVQVKDTLAMSHRCRADENAPLIAANRNVL